MRKVLITGANGYLGRRLIRRLSESHAIAALVRRPAAKSSITTHVGELDRLAITVADPCNPDVLIGLGGDCDVAVHLIGTIKETRRNRYADSHIRPAQALARAVASTSIKKIIYVSILGADKNSPVGCLRQRAAVEELFLAAAAPQTVVIRVPMVLGEGDRASAALAKRARAERVLLFNAASREQPIYAGDMIEAIVAAFSATTPVPPILDLAGPESLPRAQLVRRAAQLLGHDPKIISLPLSFGLASAWFVETFSKRPRITRDMLRVLDHDDQIDPANACHALKLELTPLDEMLRRCIKSYPNKASG